MKKYIFLSLILLITFDLSSCIGNIYDNFFYYKDSSNLSPQLKSLFDNLESWEGQNIDEFLKHMPLFSYFTTYYDQKKSYAWKTETFINNSNHIDLSKNRKNKYNNDLTNCTLHVRTRPDGTISNFSFFGKNKYCILFYNYNKFPPPPDQLKKE